jgi:hypothetical protein
MQTGGSPDSPDASAPKHSQASRIIPVFHGTYWSPSKVNSSLNMKKSIIILQSAKNLINAAESETCRSLGVTPNLRNLISTPSPTGSISPKWVV